MTPAAPRADCARCHSLATVPLTRTAPGVYAGTCAWCGARWEMVFVRETRTKESKP